jgi:hypothetical protein
MIKKNDFFYRFGLKLFNYLNFKKNIIDSHFLGIISISILIDINIL